MYGRFTGYYELSDLADCILSGSHSEIELSDYLPQKNYYYFASGREALYTCLLNRKKNSTKRYVAIPAWGCPVVAAVVHKSGFTPLLFDVNPDSLHLNINDLTYLTKSYDIDSVLLIAENGIPYSMIEYQILSKCGLNIISDFATAWQNINPKFSSQSDYEIFSGGFSKPASGIGFGALTTKHDIEIPAQVNQEGFSDKIMPLKILLHLLIQKPGFYRLFKPFIRTDINTEFDGLIKILPEKNKKLIFNSLERIKIYKKEWLDLQKATFELFREKGIQSPSVNYPLTLQSKIVFNKNSLRKKLKYHIEYHKQYSYNLLTDPRCEKPEGSFEGIRKIRDEFVSFAINGVILSNSDKFFKALKSDLK